VPDPKNAPEAATAKDTEALRTLVDRAKGGDTSTVPALRKLLECSSLVDQLGGNLAQQAERSFIEGCSN
jgi:hypothetical protein